MAAAVKLSTSCTLWPVVATVLYRLLNANCTLDLMQVLVKVNPEGKYVVDIDKDIDVNKCTPNTRVALRNDSYVLHKILPTKVRREYCGWCCTFCWIAEHRRSVVRFEKRVEMALFV